MVNYKSGILRIAERKIDLNNLKKTIEKSLNGKKTIILLKQTNGETKIPVLFVEQQDEKGVSLESLKGCIKDAEVIKEIVSLSSFPLDSNGEIDERELKKLLDELPIIPKLSEMSDVDLTTLHMEKFKTAEPIHIKDILLKDDSSEKKEKNIENISTNVKKAYVNGGKIEDVIGDVNNVPAMLLRVVEMYPGKGIHNIDREGNEKFISYCQLLENSKKILNGLRNRGVKAGDKVILLIDSNEKYYYALWGCFIGGIIPAPMTAPTNFSARSNDIKVLRSVWETIENPVILSIQYLIENISEYCGEMQFVDVETLLMECNLCCEKENVNSDNAAILMFTSGSTGRPKGVVQSHINISNKMRAAVQFSGYRYDDIFLNWLSIEHVVGLIAFHIMPIYLGADQVQIETDYILEAPLRWIELSSRFKATMTWAPNSLFALINDSIEDNTQYKWDLSSLKRVINAGESVNNETCRKFLKNLIPYGLDGNSVKPEWGMSETCCMTIASDSFCDGNSEGIQILNKNYLDRDIVLCSENSQDKITFVECGKIYPGLEMRVVDNDYNFLSECQIGRFQVRGQMVLPEYYNNPEVNKDSFTKDGWFDTGDLAFIKDKNVIFTGRMKDVIIINGINYQNVDIETCVEEIDNIDVTFTAACAVKDNDENTDSVVVFYVPLQRGKKAIKQQISKIKEHIFTTMGLKVKYVLPVSREDIPKTNIGKIQRSQLVIRFKNGNFSELIKEMDILLDNEEVIKPWFFRKTNIKKSVNKFVPFFKDKKALIIGKKADIYGISNELNNVGLECAVCCEDISETPSLVVDMRLFDSGVENFTEILGVSDIINKRKASSDIMRYYIVVSNSTDNGYVEGIIKSINQEESNIRITLICTSSDYVSAISKDIITEISNFEWDEIVFYNDGERYVESLECVDIRSEFRDNSKLIHGGKYVITGGSGGIGYHLAKKLINDISCEVLLVGRTPYNEMTADKAKNINELLELNDKVSYISADISTEAGIDIIKNAIESKWNSKFDGIFHLAGVGTFSDEYDSEKHFFRDESIETFNEYFAPKVKGTCNLVNLLEKDTLFVVFGSINAYFGGTGYSAYSGANSFISKYVDSLIEQGYNNCYCMSWSAWSDIGMSQNNMYINAIREKGYIPLMRTQALYSMLAILRTDIHNVYIGLNFESYNIRREMRKKEDLHIETVLFYRSHIAESVRRLSEEHNIERCICVNDNVLDNNGMWDNRKLLNLIKMEDDEFLEVETNTEKKLADIWASLLGVSNIGRNSDFFALGGHSLIVTKLNADIKKTFNVKISLNEIFRNSNLQQLAQKIDGMLGKDNNDNDVIPVEKKEYYELSYAQQRVFMIERLEKVSGLYNIVGAWDINGNIDTDIFTVAISLLTQRHQMLRTTFEIIEGSPVQKVHKKMNIPFIKLNMEGLPEIIQAQKTEELIQEECNRSFDLGKGPLMAVNLIQKSENINVLIISQHHIISDGWSFGILVRELEEIYNALAEGRNIEFEDIPVRVVNYIEWSNQKVIESNADKEFWINKLKDASDVLQLPIDFKRPDIQTYNGDTIIRNIDKSYKEKIDSFCLKYSSTPFIMLFAAYCIFLYKMTGQKNTVVGIPVSGREDAATRNMIGMFVNSLAICNNIDVNVKIDDFINNIKDTLMEAYSHQNYPFDRVVDALNPARNLSTTPVFQTMFNYLNVHLNMNLSGVEVIEHEVNHKISKYDLSVNILDTDDNFSISFEYNVDLCTRETINRWFDYYFNVIEQIISDNNCAIADVELINDVEKKEILSHNNTQLIPLDKSIGELFGETVSEFSSHIAVKYKDKSMTYAELNEKSDELAGVLARAGVKRGDKVGIYAERTIETIAAVLAIIKCGAAYVPINMKYSEKIVMHMLDDCAIDIVVSNRNDEFILDRKNICFSQKYKMDDYDRQVMASDDAYVIYTSGTTGMPKGVVVSHRNVVRLVRDIDWFSFERDDVILQTGALSFDASTFEIWGALLNGLTLCLVDEDCILSTKSLKNEIAKNKVTIMWVSAPLFEQLVESEASVFKGCRKLLVGGDVLSPKHINKVRHICNGIEIYNGYGPTENTTFSTVFRIERDFENSIPIGSPITYSTAYVVNESNQLQPYGVIGELIVGGYGVAKGYLNQSELTSKKFVENPFVKGEVVYRTGDYVKLDQNGIIHFCGRIDNQVKIRGFRIELDLIQNCLMKCPIVKNAVVNLGNSKIIEAYFVSEQDGVREVVMEYLKHNLANYMIPAKLIQIDRIPLNTNGKVDMAVLTTMQESENCKQYDEFESAEERELLDIFRRVLQNPSFEVNDNFFEFGGDSLLTIRLSSELRKIGYNVEPKMIFMFPMVKELSKILCTDNDNSKEVLSPEDYLIKIHDGDENGTNLILAPPAGGTILGYIELARHFKSLGNVYGIQAPGLYENENPQYLNFDEMVSFCVDSIKDTFRPGLDYIGGHSLGGHFAYAMCIELKKRGLMPKGILILDTLPKLNKINTEVKKDISEEEFKLFVLTMGIGNMLNHDFSYLKEMKYEDAKAEIIRISKEDSYISSFFDEEYLDKYLKMQFHHILLARDVVLPKCELDIPIKIVRTTENEQYVKALFNEWQEYTSQKIEIVDFESNHTSMMKLPHVVKLAEIVEKLLEE